MDHGTNPIPDFSKMTSAESFTEYLRNTHRAEWEAATDNRFIRELVADEIEDTVYARYLTWTTPLLTPSSPHSDMPSRLLGACPRNPILKFSGGADKRGE